MHTQDQTDPFPVRPYSKKAVNRFILDLRAVLDDKATDHLVHWGDRGESLVINDFQVFTDDLMPHHFRLYNWKSFHRQLNIYDFKMSASIGQTKEFAHPCFKRDEPELQRRLARNDIERNRIRSRAELNALALGHAFPFPVSTGGPIFEVAREQERVSGN